MKTKPKLVMFMEVRWYRDLDGNKPNPPYWEVVFGKRFMPGTESEMTNPKARHQFCNN